MEKFANIETESSHETHTREAQISVANMFNSAMEADVRITTVTNPSERK